MLLYLNDIFIYLMMKPFFFSPVQICLSTLLSLAALPAFAQVCTGQVISTPDGMHEVQDESLLKAALGEPGKGSLCTAKVFEVDKPVRLFRVYNAAQPASLYGRWWSLQVPVGPRTQYAAENAICPEWSPLNAAATCTLKPGVRVVIGPGQSAQCASGEVLPASATNQVYVANDARAQKTLVDNCSEPLVWP